MNIKKLAIVSVVEWVVALVAQSLLGSSVSFWPTVALGGVIAVSNVYIAANSNEYD